MSNKVVAIIVVAALFSTAWYMIYQKATTLPVEYNKSIMFARDNATNGIYKKALANYKNALSIKDDDIDLNIEIADVYLKSGSEKSFVSYCEKITKTFPKTKSPTKFLQSIMQENHSM